MCFESEIDVVLAQGMRRDLLGNSGVADGIVKNHEDVVGTDRLARGSSGEEPLRGLVVSPILPQGVK
jgi:hypothetical protein